MTRRLTRNQELANRALTNATKERAKDVAPDLRVTPTPNQGDNKMMKRQTIAQAIHLIDREIGTIRHCGTVLTGLPAGEWGETTQALTQFRDLLPLRLRRSYTDVELINAIYTTGATGRYQRR